jgi:hypothetical protein
MRVWTVRGNVIRTPEAGQSFVATGQQATDRHDRLASAITRARQLHREESAGCTAGSTGSPRPVNPARLTTGKSCDDCPSLRAGGRRECHARASGHPAASWCASTANHPAPVCAGTTGRHGGTGQAVNAQATMGNVMARTTMGMSCPHRRASGVHDAPKPQTLGARVRRDYAGFMEGTVQAVNAQATMGKCHGADDDGNVMPAQAGIQRS